MPRFVSELAQTMVGTMVSMSAKGATNTGTAGRKRAYCGDAERQRNCKKTIGRRCAASVSYAPMIFFVALIAKRAECRRIEPDMQWTRLNLTVVGFSC